METKEKNFENGIKAYLLFNEYITGKQEVNE